MQKKIIASLLVSPMAISAMANINVTGVQVENWTASNGAVTGGIVSGNKVTVPVGIGSVTNSFVAPAPGTYKLEFSDLVGATVTVNGKAVTVDADAGTLTFDVTNINETVTFVVSPVSAAAGYSFVQGATEIVFNFEEAQNALNTAFAAIPEIATLTDGDDSEAAEALKAKIAEIEAKKTAIQAQIDLVKEADPADAKVDLATYSNTELKLYENPNAVAKAIADLVAEIGANTETDPDATPVYPEGSLNADIEHQNKVFNAAANNAALKATATTQVTAVEESLTELTALYTTVKGLYDTANDTTGNALFATEGKAKYDAATAAVEALKTLFDTTFAEENMTNPDLEWADDADADAKDAITAATSALNDLKTYVEAYNEFQSWYTDESTVDKVYNQARVAISSLKSLTQYPGAFETFKASVMSSLSAEYKNCTDAKATVKLDADAAKNAADAKTAIEGAVTAMGDLKTNAQEKVAEQNLLMEGVTAEDGTVTTPGALTVIAALQKTLDASIEGMDETTLKTLGVTDEQYTTFAEAVQAVQDKIDALKTTCETKYKGLILKESDFTGDDNEALKAVTDAQTALDTTITDLKLDDLKAAAAAIGGLRKDLKDFEDKLKEYKEKSEGVDFPNIFDGNIKSLTAAIDALNADNYAGATDPIKQQITDVTAFAETIYNVVMDAHTTINTYEQGLEDLNKYIAAKEANLLTGGDDTTFDLAAFKSTVAAEQTTVDGWKTTYSSVIELAKAENVQGQKVYDAAKKLSDEMAKTKVIEVLTANFNDLEENGTAYNISAVEAALKTVTDNTSAVVDVTELQGELDTIKAAVEEADNADDAEWGANETTDDGEEVLATDVKAEKYAGFDTELKDLKAKVQKVIDSQAKYATLLPALDGVLAAIESDVTYNKNSVSGEEAQAFYTAKIGKSVAVDGDDDATAAAEAAAVVKTDGVPDVSAATTLYAKYYTLKGLLNYYLANGTVADEANSTAYTNRVKDVTDAANDLKTAMQENEAALYTLLDDSQQTRTLIEGFLAQLNGNATGEDVVNYDPNIPEVANAIYVMNGLLDKDLMAADSAVTAKYNVGECATDTTLAEAFETIRKAANDEMKKLNGEYGEIVAEANAKIIADSGVAQAIIDGNAAYSAAIKVFNAYKNLENAGYKAYVDKQEGSKNHEALYDFASKLIKLKSDVTTAEETANGKSEILDAEDFAKKYVDVVNATDIGYIAQINKLRDQIISDYNTWGGEYYTELTGKVQVNIDAAKTAIAEAGLEDSEDAILKDVNDTMTAASDAETAAKAVTDPADYNKQIGYVMDSIATDLDPYAGDGIDLTAAATAAWKAAYDNNSETKPGALQQIAAWNAKVAAMKNVGADAKAEYQTVADAAKVAVEAANTTFTTSNNKIGVLSDCMKALNDALATLVNENESGDDAGAFTKIDNLDKAIGEQSALKAELDASVVDLNDAFAALKAFANPMGVAASEDYTDIETAISDIQNQIKTNFEGNKLEEAKDDIKTAITDAEALIAAKYATVATDEVTYLNKLVDQAKVAYNNARSVEGAPEYGEQNTEINEVAAALASLTLPANATDAEKTAFATTAVGYEDKLSKVINYLQNTDNYPKVDGEVTVAGILAELQEKAGTIQNAINDAKDGLADYLPTLNEYDEAYQDLLNQLNEVVDNFNDAGDKLIAQGDNYKAQLEDIEAAVEALEPKVTAAKEAAQAEIDSNARAEVLMGEYNTLKTLLESVETALGNQGYDVLDDVYTGNVTYGAKLTEIAGNLTAMQEWIEEENGKHALTEDSVYENDGVNVNSIDYSIKAAMLSGSKAYAEGLNGTKDDTADDETAFGKVTAVNNALATSSILPEDKATITADAKKLEDRATANGTSIAAFKVADYDTTDEDTSIVSMSDEQYQSALGVIDGYITESNNIITAAEDLMKKLTESEFIPGVVTPGETEVNVNDIQTIITWALEAMSVEDLTEEVGANYAYAADLDGNEQIDVTDVSLAIQLFLGTTDQNALSPTMLKVARFKASVDENLHMGLMRGAENNGVRRYAITLDNAMQIVSGQVDLKLPAGMRVVDASVAERNGNHSVQFKDNGDFTRVLIYSMDNAAFNGSEGAVLYIDVEGDGNLSVDQMVVVDSYMKSHVVAASGSSFVDSIIDGAKEVKSRIYNAAGMMFDKLQNGINIIRDSNGKVRKQMNRNK